MSSKTNITPNPALTAQASVWLARLRSEDRTRADEAGFQDWLAEDPHHRAAFDATTAAWEAVGALNLRRQQDAARGRRPAFARRAVLIGGLAASAAAAAYVTLSGVLDGWTDYTTAVGETRTVALSDGSLLILDTDTAIRTALGPQQRRVEILKGRAHFAVAKDPMRPFVVSAAARQVVAVGTAFDVTRDATTTTVLLIEGHVLVREQRGISSERVADMNEPGVRLVIEDVGRVTEDRPNLRRITSWQNGRLIFENETLAAAVAEMNRYSRRQIVLGAKGLNQLRFSGVYVSGDPLAFATSVATLFDLSMRDEPTRTLLAPTASTPAAPS
jgi:transmembrane sensor